MNGSDATVAGWFCSRLNTPAGVLRGYGLTDHDGIRQLAFIHTLGPHARIEELLSQYAKQDLQPRQLMRKLLGAEEYTSDVYDTIVRVYYSDDLMRLMSK